MLPRRSLLLLGLVGGVAALTGCQSTNHTVAHPPNPEWPKDAPRPMTPPRAPSPQPAPVQSAPPMPGVMARSTWAKGGPDMGNINPMLPIRNITIHHDALTPFYATDAASTQARIELIRSSHRQKNWADIGYHFAIDRSGRVYEARSIRFQGAHVKDHNEGNIGILCLGNFEVQWPSEQQLNALAVHARTLRRKYNVPANAVVTHREWRGAQTLCPGGRLQTKVEVLRANKAFV
jgi:hypothetical protein